MKHRFTAIALLLAAVSGASAQESQNAKANEAAQGTQDEHGVRLELRPFAGRYIPTSRMSDDFKSANTLGGQTALELSEHLHVVASVGVTDGTSTIGALSNGAVKMWQYDGGVEVNGVSPIGSSGWSFRPFAGAGAGARTYSYEEVGVGSRTGLTGYGTVGAELRRSAIALRLEGRGYVNSFKQPLIDESSIRNDASLSLGLAYHLF